MFIKKVEYSGPLVKITRFNKQVVEILYYLY